MCSKVNRMKLNIYRYFSDGEPHHFLTAVIDLESQGIKFNTFYSGVDDFILAMKGAEQLEKLSDSDKGGQYRLTELGKIEYEKWQVSAGVTSEA